MYMDINYYWRAEYGGIAYTEHVCRLRPRSDSVKHHTKRVDVDDD